MKTNGTNPGENFEEFENMSNESSNTGKRIAVGAAVIGAAGLGAGAMYAAQPVEDPFIDDELTADNLVEGAEVGADYTPQPEQPAPVAPAPVTPEPQQPEPEPDPFEWNEKTTVYVGDEKVVSQVEGTYEGNKVSLVDIDGDDKADYIAYDQNGDGEFQSNEVMEVSERDNIAMNMDVHKVSEIHYQRYPMAFEDENNQTDPNHDDMAMVSNDFDAEKAGEEYKGDFAENNPDYNPDAPVDSYASDYSLAENTDYDEESDSEYTDNYYAQNDGGYGSDEMGGEEFLG